METFNMKCEAYKQALVDIQAIIEMDMHGDVAEYKYDAICDIMDTLKAELRALSLEEGYDL